MFRKSNLIALGLFVSLALSPLVGLSAEETVTEQVVAAAEVVTPGFKEQAAEVLQSLIAAATKTGEFIGEQAPLVIKELLLFNTIKLWFYTLIGACLIIATPIWAVKFYNRAIRINKDLSWPYTKEAPHVLAIVPAVFFGAFGLGFFFDNIDEALKITLAPRIWLLEYAADLVR